MNNSPLTGLRVVEFPGVETLFIGKLFADLGASVTRLEPPAGDPARRYPPLVTSPAGETVSAAWLAYAIGRQHVSLDPDRPSEAREALLGAADVVLHPFTAAQAGDRDIAYPGLCARNPAAIVVALTPFGSEGPHAGWAASDLTQFAASGYLHMTGPAEGRPIQPSAPMQTYLHAANHAFAAALLALRRRRLTGQGAFIDQSIRETGAWMLTHTYQHWDMQRVNLRRQGAGRDMGARRRLRAVFPSADGHVVWMFTTGHLGARSNRALVAWMAESAMAPEWLRAIDWETADLLASADDLQERLESAFGAFFAARSGAELLEWAITNGLMLAPMQTLGDLPADPQLAARDAWRTHEFPGFGPLRVPGPPVRITGVRWELAASPASMNAPANSWFAPSAAPASVPELPLAGVRVLDLGSTLAAPIVARLLSDFGADVIEVESASHPDTLRVGTPYAEGTGLDRSGYFAAYSAGKRSFALNLQAPGALDVLRRLVERADILVENFAPGVMGRLGLTPEVLHAWNPRLVFASHSLQGQTGPRSAHRGYGQIASAMTGWYDLTGEEDGEPLGPYSAYTDFLSWPLLLSAILIALEERDRTRGRAVHRSRPGRIVAALPRPVPS